MDLARLKEERIRKGITKERVAEALHISKDTYEAIERGEREVSFFGLTLIAEALGFSNNLFYEIFLKDDVPCVPSDEPELLGHMSFADRIRLLRIERGLTQKEFGESIGVELPTVVNYERGSRIPIDQVKVSICKNFNVTMDYLYGLSELRTSLDKAYFSTNALTKELNRRGYRVFKEVKP